MSYTSIEDASLDELAHILSYLETRDGDKPPVLIGGWAVHAHVGPQYLRSIDIDFVLKARDRDSLIHWAVEERGFERRTQMADSWKGAAKTVPELRQEIILDTASYEQPNVFHGREESLPFSLVEDNHVWTDAYGVRVRVPTRSLLLLFKGKAAFDRAARLAEGVAPDVPYTRAKLVKDRADILALLQHRTDWNLGFLYRELERLSFMPEVWHEACEDGAARERAGVGYADAREGVEHLVGQVGED